LVEARGLTPCRPVSDGPVQANSFSGDQVNVEALPIHKFADIDGGRYIGSACSLVRDPETGKGNMAILRHQLKGPRRLGIEMAPHVREDEGPFGEHTGCSIAGMGQNPVIDVTAVYYRDQPIYYAGSEGDRTDGATLDAIPMESVLYRRLKDVGGFVNLKSVVI